MGKGKWGEENERRVGRTMVEARAALCDFLHIDDPDGTEVVFMTLKIAADIHRREKDVGPSMSNGKGFWPDYLHDKEERLIAFKQRMIDLTAGDSPEVLFGISKITTPAELLTMEAINEVYRDCLTGRGGDKARDWKILNALAGGKSLRAVAKLHRMNYQSVSDQKERQCKAIWTRTKHLMWQDETLAWQTLMLPPDQQVVV
jgi:hypothetical protein